MASIDKTALKTLLANGPHRTLAAGKEVTLALGNLYIVTTTIIATALLVWETESGYSRYYVPVESLHQSIKARLDADTSRSGEQNGETHVGLEVLDTVKGDNGSQVVIEKLTVGSKSTTWVRFTEGSMQGYIRFERKEIGESTSAFVAFTAAKSMIDEWFENGALFVGIKNPYKRIDTTPVARHVVVKIDGQTVAETTVAVLLSETGLKEAYYLPATSIKDWSLTEKSDWRTTCPYKGEAW